MTTRHLIDPEILPLLDAFPPLSLQREMLPVLRQAFADQMELATIKAESVQREDRHIPSLKPEDAPIRCLIYRPSAVDADSGAYLHLHGGGYVIDAPDSYDAQNIRLCEDLGITIVSVDYRLAPEHPAPAALEDAYAALAWMHGNAAELKIDPSRIAVGGESAGGGLAAALALHARDLGQYKICFQLLTYPMLDDRTGSEGHAGDPMTGEFVWTRELNQLAWSHYLGGAEPLAPSVPARAQSFEGLPPTWIGTASQDLFRDENIDYAQRLLNAGV
ncbi:MAG: alpha/beta hydrolase, partial [Pseudomonadota bacterium]